MIICKYIESLELAYGSKGKEPGRNNKTDYSDYKTVWLLSGKAVQSLSGREEILL